MRMSLLITMLAVFATLPIVRGHEPKGQPDQKLPWVTAKATVPRVEFRTFDSKTVGAKVSYHVFTPAVYDAPDKKLPVLYWLHGTEGGIAGINPLTKYFDNEMTAGRIPPMIIVFVNGLPRRLWADSKTGAAPVETVFIKEVIPDVDKNFRTIASPEGRILEGFSMGGYGAARLGFRHLELFAGISILAGGPLDLDFQGPRAKKNPQLREFILREVCDNDAEYFKSLSPLTIVEQAADTIKEKKLTIRHVVGQQDDTRDLNNKFHDQLTSLKIAHEYKELAKVGHDCLAIFTTLGEQNGAFYRSVLGQSGGPAK